MTLGSNKIATLCAVALAVVGTGLTLGSVLHSKKPGLSQALQSKGMPEARESTKTGPSRLMMSIALQEALERNMVEASYTCDGLSRLRIQLRSTMPGPVRVVIPDGVIFRAGRSSVVTFREKGIAVPAGANVTDEVPVVALSSANVIAESGYELTHEEDGRLSALFAFLRKHPEVPTGSVQTAALAITENLPLRAFAKFAFPMANVPSAFDNSPFKVDTIEIVKALGVLRGIGIPDDQLALTVDPQLRIEAMIDPLAHAAAMKHYGIRDEWKFWKGELTKGDLSTRHYALYGIARFFPDVAIKMLPTWVRETRTDPVYRISAVQALAETHQIEAVSTLRQLARELGSGTEIGKTALTAADYLEENLTKPYVPIIPFRLTRLPEPIPSPLLETIPVLAAAN